MSGKKSYRSCGTIRAAIRFDGKPPTGGIRFIPDQDHLVKHQNKCYAAFASVSTESIDGRLFLLEKDEHDKYSASLECSTASGGCLVVAVAIASATQVKVEVEVEEKKSHAAPDDCKVVAITIPAK